MENKDLLKFAKILMIIVLILSFFDLVVGVIYTNMNLEAIKYEKLAQQCTDMSNCEANNLWSETNTKVNTFMTYTNVPSILGVFLFDLAILFLIIYLSKKEK